MHTFLIPTLAGYAVYAAKVGIKMYALSSCFTSATCLDAFIVVPTNTKNSIFFSDTCLYVLFLVGYTIL